MTPPGRFPAPDQLHVSFYEAVNRPTAQTCALTWDKVAEALTQHATSEDKSGVRLFNFCRYTTAYRANEFVVDVGALLLDLDDVTAKQLAAVNAKLSPYQRVLHTTHSHGLEGIRLRVVVRLARPVLREEWGAFSHGIERWLGGIVDHCVANPSQSYYLPSSPADRAHLRYAADFPGAMLDVDAVLASVPMQVDAALPTDVSWRPERVITPADLRAFSQRGDRMGEIARALFAGQKIAPEGKRHYARRDFVFALLCEFGPCMPDAGALQLLVNGADAHRDVWIREFSSYRARDRAEQKHTAAQAALAESKVMTDAIVNVVDQSLAQASADAQVAVAAGRRVVTSELVIDFAKKSRDPLIKRVLMKLATGNVDVDYEAAVATAGVWLGRTQHTRELGALCSAFTHVQGEQREVLFRAIAAGKAEGDHKEDWRRACLPDENGKIPGNENTARAILQLHPDVRGKLFYNERRDRIEAVGAPWGHDGEISDSTLGAIQAWIAKIAGCPVPSAAIYTAICGLQDMLPSYDPVRQYLEGLVPVQPLYLDRWLVDFAGAPDTPYVREVGRRWLLSAVARTFQPGCQVDQVLVLEGPQGGGKTSLVHALVPVQNWVDNLEGSLTSTNKDTVQKASSGPWILELGELAGIRKSDWEAIKNFITLRRDTYRAPYGRIMKERARRMVMVGTTNSRDYLQDPSGNRRFLPVQAERCDPLRLKAVRDHLWSEAVMAYRAGEHWWVEQTAEVVAEQDERMEEDPVECKILQCAEHFAEGVSLLQIYAYLGWSSSERRNAYRIRSVLLRHGYRQLRRTRRTIVVPQVPGSFVGSQLDLADRWWARKPDPRESRTAG